MTIYEKEKPIDKEHSLFIAEKTYLMLANDEVDEAKTYLTEIMKSGFFDRNLACLTAIIFLFEGNFDAALGTINHTLKLSPNFFLARYYKCEILYSSGSYDDAITEVDRLINDMNNDSLFKNQLLHKIVHDFHNFLNREKTEKKHCPF